MIPSFLKRTAVVTLFFSLCFMTGANLIQGSSGEDQLQKAERLSKEMLYEEAIKILNDFIQSNAADPGKKTEVAKAYYLLARIYFDVDEKDPQIKENLGKTFEYDPGFSTEEINVAFKKIVEEVKAGGEVKVVSKFKLTVDIAAGASGSPDKGTYTYVKGKRVRYNYNAERGAANLKVLLDGKSVRNRGTITMDENHTLTVTTTRIATVIVNSYPDGANIYVDGTDTGHKTSHTFIYTSEDLHTYLLRKVGYKDYQTPVKAELAQTITVNKDLEKGLRETFDRGAASSILWQWQPNPACKWTLVNGGYTSTARNVFWNYIIYNHNFASSKFTLTVKMKRTVGKKKTANGVALITGTNPKAISGYFFNYSAGGDVCIWNVSNWNIDTVQGRFLVIGPWVSFPAVNKDLGSYNTFKIQRDGNKYTYYLNNSKIYTFPDSTHNPSYIFIGGECGGQTTQLFVDYVYLDVGL